MKLRKLLSLALALVMLLGCMTITAFATETKQLTVNNGTSSVAGFPYGMMDTSDVKFKSQFIQPSSTLAVMKGGTISKMTFYVQNTPGDNDAVFEVRLKEVTATSYTSDNLIDVTDATLVYTGKANPDANNQVVISFTTPYEYNGGNLLVDFRIITAGVGKLTMFHGASQSYACGINGANSYYQGTFLPKVTFDYEVPTYLDLEASDPSHAESKTIDQTYTFTQTSENYVDVTKVKLEWAINDLAATFKSHKTWDPDQMKWVETKEDIQATDYGASFTFTNYSSKAVQAKVAFTVEDSLKDTFEKATFTNNGCKVDTPVKQDSSTYTKDQFVANAQTIEATLTFKTTGFTNLEEVTASNTKYGTYSITISEPLKLITFAEMTENASGATVSENTIQFNGSTWEEIVENNKDNTIKITTGGKTYECTLAIFGYEDVALKNGSTFFAYLFVSDSLEKGGELLTSASITDTLYFFLPQE